jgi:predicted phage terminase large subunit-like protein
MNRNKELLKVMARISLAQDDFWYYLKLMCPTFYKESRLYLKKMARDLQEYWDSGVPYLIINMPPQHGKSLTIRYFISWLFGKYGNDIHVQAASYNVTLSERASKQIKDDIETKKTSEFSIVYHDIFPNIKLKAGSKRKDYWTLEGGFDNFLATSPNGSVTGFGATVQIYDDVFRDYYDACNQKLKDDLWESWYQGTMQSRMRDGRQIFIQTRWCSDDFTGRLIEQCEKLNVEYRHICYSLDQPDGSLLCAELMPQTRYYIIKNSVLPDVYEANYNQRPIDTKTRLYNRFNFWVTPQEKENLKKNYNEEDYKQLNVRCVDIKDFETIGAYVDTADTGEDYLAMVIFGCYKEKIYLLDVYYTQDSMETTEIEAADLLNKWQVQYCKVESNNGGRGWGRNVLRNLQEFYDNETIQIEGFTQSKNKVSRIISKSGNVMRDIHYPYGWSDLNHPNLNVRNAMRDLTRYDRVGKNAHDDIEDALTGVWEMCAENGYVYNEV